MKRFWDKVVKLEGLDSCWEWQAGLTSGGYGKFKINKKTKTAHRVCWEISNGAILNGLHVLHKCDNRRCVNPSHLFLGTAKDNILDMHSKGRAVSANRAKTHCKYGHPYNEENTYNLPTIGRVCKICRRNQDDKRSEKRKRIYHLNKLRY